MKAFERDILNLIKCGITGEKTSVSTDLNLDVVINFAKKHQIFSMLYYGIINSEIKLSDTAQNAFDSIIPKCTAINHFQQDAILEISSIFIENNIDFLLIKGILLKNIYPKPDMRFMSDADILIKPKQFHKIKPLMESLGFEFMLESNHEYVFKKGKILYIELHKYLIPSYNKDYFEYYGDGWRLAHKTSTSKYELTNEDHFIYLFTHYAKHYRDSGVGIKYLVDLYVVLNQQNLDIEYIEQELKLLKLYNFYKNTLSTLDVWFNNAPDTEITDFITSKIFESGVYGTASTSTISQALKQSKSLSENSVCKFKLLKLIFPPFNVMKNRYKFLSKLPFLLPFMWIVRILSTLIFKRSNIKKQRQKMTLITPENISKYQNELNYVGLDFDFKE